MYFYSSGKFRDPNGTVGLPSKVAQGSGPLAQLRGRNCFVEVTLGCQDKMVRNNANLHSNFSQPHGTESPATRLCNQRWPLDKLPACEKKFVYPTEAVLVPVMQTSFARSSLKRYYHLTSLTLDNTCICSLLKQFCTFQILAAELGWTIFVGFITCYALVRPDVSNLFII